MPRIQIIGTRVPKHEENALGGAALRPRTRFLRPAILRRLPKGAAVFDRNNFFRRNVMSGKESIRPSAAQLTIISIQKERDI